jgi:uncharacterized protein YkuJ
VANSKEPYILLTLYQNLYKDKYNKAVTINKFREKWAMQDVIDSVGYTRAKELLEYYFGLTKNGHPLQFFFYNFDKMDLVKIEIEKDKEKRRLLLEETKKMVEQGGIE